jgi:putative endonuclease
MPHFIYILYSEKTDHYYIGSCADIETRLQRHNAGATLSTKHGRPWRVVYSETFDDKTKALKRENYLKSLKSRKFIEILILNSMAR